MLLAATVIACAIAILTGLSGLPGTPARQLAAIVGTALLLTPLAFTLLKRSGLSASPPTWFVVHVLASAAGCVLVFVHAAGGHWVSPPGLVLLALGFLIVQGVLARAYLSKSLSNRFAGHAASFSADRAVSRDALAGLIACKRVLLAELDPDADEALFSPHLGHWLRRPYLSLHYARLAGAESRLVGARRRSGLLLAYWRRVHIAIAVAFGVGVAIHVIVVTFFAGYVADGGDIYWWHLATWGAVR